MDGEFGLLRTKIQDAIDSGKVTVDSVERGLRALIDEELKQTDRPVDMRLINSCFELLERLNGTAYVSQKESSLRAIKAKLHRKAAINLFSRTLPRVAAVLAIMVIGGIGIDALIDQEYLTASPTVDQQHYQIRGNIVESNIVADSQAEGAAGNLNLEDIAFEDLPSILGFVPPYPHCLPEGWKPGKFRATISRFALEVNITYNNPERPDLLQYTIMNYTDIEAAATSFEQSKNGIAHHWGNATVYLAFNYDRLIAVWMENNTCYSLSGPLSEEQMRKTIESIGTEENS